MIWRKGQVVIHPGFGLMDGEFTFYINRVDRLTRRFKPAAGLMGGWYPMRDYRWDSGGRRWVHYTLPLDVEA